MSDTTNLCETVIPLKKDKFFSLSKTARTDVTQRLINEVTAEIDAYEARCAVRRRKRKAEDKLVFDRTVSAIMCNLVHAVLTEDSRGMAIPRSNRTLGQRGRYTPPAQSRQIPYVLDLLANPELRWLRQELGEKNPFARNQLTLVWPIERVAEAIAKYNIDLSDIGRDLQEEVIILKSGKDEYWTESKRLDYDDSAETIAYRAEVTEINTFFSKADIDFDDACHARSCPVDTQDRVLRRCFSRGSFRSGGRLFGGFWQGLPKEERIAGTLINGEQVVGLDYGQIATRILYGLAGATPPPGDLYEIPGLTRLNGRCYRDGVKTIMNSLMFTDDSPKRKPKGSGDKLPRNLSIKEITDLIKAAHPGIAHMLGANIGHDIQFIESTIMTRVITELMSDGVVALPIHDGLIVQAKYEGKAKEVMQEVFKAEVGLPCPVTREVVGEGVGYRGVVDWRGTREAAV